MILCHRTDSEGRNPLGKTQQLYNCDFPKDLNESYFLKLFIIKFFYITKVNRQPQQIPMSLSTQLQQPSFVLLALPILP